MSDPEKPKKPGDGGDKVAPGRSRPVPPPRPSPRLPPAALDFDPDELIDTAFKTLETEVGDQGPPLDPDQDQDQDQDPAGAIPAEPPTVRGLGRVSDPHTLTPSEAELRNRDTSPATADDEAAPTVELQFESDFADPEDIAFAEDLAEQWEDRHVDLDARRPTPSPVVATRVLASPKYEAPPRVVFNVDDELPPEASASAIALALEEPPSLTETSAQAFVVERVLPESPARSQPVASAPGPSYGDASSTGTTTSPAQPTPEKAWEVRAAWLEQEARATRDPHAQARSYLVASELWAMTGALEKAEQCADLAHKLWGSLALAARQVRWLKARVRDWPGVSAVLESETRSAPTPDARVHAANFHADILSLALDDMAQARRKIELGARAKPDDIRPHVARLADHLGESAGAPRMLWPKEELSPKLKAAVAQIAVLRGGPLAEAPTEDASTRAALHFEQARRHLETGNAAGAAASIEQLTAELGDAKDVGTWLSTALLALSSETRALAIEKLSELRGRRPSASVGRALLKRALEQSDFAAAGSALETLGSSLDVESRAALALLMGAGDLQGLDSLAEDDALLPLSVALRAASGLPVFGSPRERESCPELTASELGRAAVRNAADSVRSLESALEAYASAPASAALLKVLTLEAHQLGANTNRIAFELARWPHGDTEARDAERDRHVAAALLYEQSGNAEAALTEYREANRVDASREAIARALIEYGGERHKLLGAVAQTCEDDLQSALLSLEIASASELDPVEIDVLLARAADSPIVAPLAQHLGEWHTRHSRDNKRLLAWLQARRQEADDPAERAIALVREARVLSNTDPLLAASLLEESSQLRPKDTALRRIYERSNPALTGEMRATWREAVAAQSNSVTGQWLYLEAALEYDRMDDPVRVARTCRAALSLHPSGLAEAMLERAKSRGEEAPELGEQLLSEARQCEDAEVQRQLYERLSTIDLARGDRASARLWQSAILERNPEYLPALRHVEHAYISTGRISELESSAMILAKLSDKGEANAHAWLAARIQTRNTGSCTREVADWVIERADPPIWALRARLEQARADEDHARIQKLYELLLPQAPTKEDEAALALRAAEAALALGQFTDADRLLLRGLGAFPEHPVLLDRRTELLTITKRYREAAELLEAGARTSLVDVHRAEAWFRAAEFWQEKDGPEATSERPATLDVDSIERTQLALEQAIESNPRHAGAFARLQTLYAEKGDRGELALLLGKRLAQTTDAAERLPLEVARAKALADTGDSEGALACLRRAIDIQPEHMEALDLFADISMLCEHWEDAEQAWVSLARHLTEPAAQAETYRLLAKLYETRLPNLERAELACLEVLKRVSDDAEAGEILVRVYSKLGQAEKAVQVQTQLFKNAPSDEMRRDRILELARIFEEVAKQPNRAKQAYEQAHKVWPYDSQVLRAAADYFARTGDSATRHFMLDRAANDARRALGTGRFSASYFEVLAAVAELRNDADTAHVTRATLAALLGTPEVPPRGAGKVAADPALDDGLAPELLSPALRALIRGCGAYLDAAYPIDLKQLGIGSFATNAPALASRVSELAEFFGLRRVETHVASTPGITCLSIGSDPPRLVCSRELADLKDFKVRDFLLIKHLKVLQAHASTLARTAAHDLGPMVAGWLEALAPNYHPDVADRARVEEHSHRISQAIAGKLSPDDTSLAIEVSHALGPRTSQLSMAVNRWGNRVALLAVGDPAAAFQALALTSGLPSGLPSDPGERLKWILRNPDARNLAVFAVGTRYAEERAKLGLARAASLTPGMSMPVRPVAETPVAVHDADEELGSPVPFDPAQRDLAFRDTEAEIELPESPAPIDLAGAEGPSAQPEPRADAELDEAIEIEPEFARSEPPDPPDTPDPAPESEPHDSEPPESEPSPASEKK